MKGKIIEIVIINILVSAAVAGCVCLYFGGASNFVKATAMLEASETEQSNDIVADVDEIDDYCTDETFDSLKEQYANLLYQYNHTLYLYYDKNVEVNADIENVLTQCATFIDDMQDLTRSDISQEEAIDIEEAMNTISEALTIISDGIAS